MKLNIYAPFVKRPLSGIITLLNAIFNIFILPFIYYRDIFLSSHHSYQSAQINQCYMIAPNVHFFTEEIYPLKIIIGIKTDFPLNIIKS